MPGGIVNCKIDSLLIQKEWTIRQLLNGDLGGIVNCSIGPLSIRKKDGQLGNYSMGTWGALSIVTLDHCQFEEDESIAQWTIRQLLNGDLGGIVNCYIGPLSIQKGWTISIAEMWINSGFQCMEFNHTAFAPQDFA